MIRSLLIVTFLFFKLLSDKHYPMFYTSIGDTLYDDAHGFELLLKSPYFKKESLDIGEYLVLSTQTKDLGKSIDDRSSGSTRSKYIKALRLLEIQNRDICKKVSRRIETLSNQYRYKILTTLQANEAPCIQNALTKNVSQKNESITSFADIREIFGIYKRKLLQAREDENATLCLNDITALYHYFIVLDRAQEEYECMNFDEALKQISLYYKAINEECVEEDVAKIDLEYKNYLMKRCL